MNELFDFESPWLIGGILVALFVVLAMASLGDEAKWKNFVKEHSCKLVSTESGTNAIGLTSKGSVTTTYISGKDGYLCDDGVVHYRDN